jgi:hypothetical protein
LSPPHTNWPGIRPAIRNDYRAPLDYPMMLATTPAPPQVRFTALAFLSGLALSVLASIIQ